MPIDAAQGASASLGPAASARSPNDDLGKADFLKLMVTQLTQQDPMNPQDGAAYVAQLAQFTGLERMLNMERAMGNMVLTATATNSTLAIDFVGRNIKISGDSLTLDSGRQANMNFWVKENSTATLTIRDADGDVVRTIEQAVNAGNYQLTWDGLDNEGNPLPEGEYRFEVAAVDGDGATVASRSESIYRVKAVSFKNGYPELILDNGDAVTLAEVSEVVSDAASNPPGEE